VLSHEFIELSLCAPPENLNFIFLKKGKETHAVGEQINFNNREDFSYGNSVIFLIKNSLIRKS